MQFFKVILLVCATSVPRGDCRIETAVQVINGPDAHNEIACGMKSQAYLAETQIGRLAEDEYLKILCRRSAPPANQAENSLTTVTTTRG